jgi:hypothetical protein
MSVMPAQTRYNRKPAPVLATIAHLLTRALGRLLPPPLPRGPTGKHKPDVHLLSAHSQRDIGLID